LVFDANQHDTHQDICLQILPHRLCGINPCIYRDPM